MADIPAASSFQHPRKTGFLKKLVGRGWFSSGYWKKRYCVLDGGKLYFYEDETSKANEKTAGTISLDYYDLCEEGTAKDTKRISNVFYLGTSVRGFFDNRHLFAAGTLEECQEWIAEIQDAICGARYQRSRAGRSKVDQRREKDLNSAIQKEATFEIWVEKETPEPAETPEQDQFHIPEPTSCLLSITKDRAKGPTGRRLPQRRSMLPVERKTGNEEAKSERPSSLGGILEIKEEDSESEETEGHSREEDLDESGIKGSINNPHKEDTNSDRETLAIPESSVTLRTSPKPKRAKSALLLELEKKMVASQRRSAMLTPATREKELDNNIVLNVKNSVEAVSSRMTQLGSQIDRVEEDVTTMRKDMEKIQEQMRVSSENDAEITKEATVMEHWMEEIIKVD